MLRWSPTRAAPLLHPTLTRQYSTPHPSLTIIPQFLSGGEQSLLLAHSLALLDSPSRTTSAGRKKRKAWLKANPMHDPKRDGFMHDDAYEFEEGHFDGVIRNYREMLVRDGHFAATFPSDDSTQHERIEQVLAKVYSLLPPTSTAQTGTSSPSSALDPPPHLIMHLLHLASNGRIFPHVDNLEAFGRTIVGVSLGGGERVMKFHQVSEPSSASSPPLPRGPKEFEVLVPSGSAYIQQESLRTHYTHEVFDQSTWQGRTVGGTQRLSIMLRCPAGVLTWFRTPAPLTAHKDKRCLGKRSGDPSLAHSSAAPSSGPPAVVQNASPKYEGHYLHVSDVPSMFRDPSPPNETRSLAKCRFLTHRQRVIYA
ncbi:hypothetical protein JCM11491_006979 [Sporobolomyces phaffii]